MGKQLLAAQGFKVELGDGLYISGEVKTIADGAAKPVLIVSHGFRGHKTWGFWPDVTNRFAEQGFYTISYDFSRISAKNDALGEHVVAEASTVSTELLDLETIVAELLQGVLPLSKEADVERLFLLGHSRSGGSSIIFGTLQPFPILSPVIIKRKGITPFADLVHVLIRPIEYAIHPAVIRELTA